MTPESELVPSSKLAGLHHRLESREVRAERAREQRGDDPVEQREPARHREVPGPVHAGAAVDGGERPRGRELHRCLDAADREVSPWLEVGDLDLVLGRATGEPADRRPSPRPDRDRPRRGHVFLDRTPRPARRQAGCRKDAIDVDGGTVDHDEQLDTCHGTIMRGARRGAVPPAGLSGRTPFRCHGTRR